MKSPRAGTIFLIALLALGGAAGAWYTRSSPAPEADRTLPEPDKAAPERRLAELENSLRAIADGERDAPRDRWDPEYVAAHVGTDPETLHDWVREHTAWIPYRGVLRGPVGVLMDRRGNGLDRALLLARLMTAAGHSVRLARAELSPEQALRLLPSLVAGEARVALESSGPGMEPPAGILEIAAHYQLDGAAIERTLVAHETATAQMLTELEHRVAEQTARLLAAVSGPDIEAEWSTRHDIALAALRDHWWVQLSTGESWVDLDLLPAGAEDGSGPMVANTTMAVADVPAELYHQLAVRVVAEQRSGDALEETLVLEHMLRPFESFGQPMVLQLWPGSLPKELHADPNSQFGLKRAALEQTSWTATLAVGSQVVAQGSITADRNPPQAMGEGPLGGFGQAIIDATRSAERPSALGGQLTAVWLEYEIHVPARAPRIVRRSVFDLIGPAARDAGRLEPANKLNEHDRLLRSLSLMMRTEILPVVAQLAPEFVVHLGAVSLLANADLLRAVARPGFGSDREVADSLLQKAEPGVSPLHTLAVLRQAALSGLGFIEQPAILTRHQYPEVRGGTVALVDATDIVANEIGIALTGNDGFAVRVTQGVWDTNLEAIFGLGGPAGNTATAFVASDNWRLWSDPRRQGLESALPANTRALMRRELESGYNVIAPDAPVVVQNEQFVGWWRIHPESGDTLGMSGNGWGQGVDYGMMVGALAEMAKPFVFAYALCQFIPQAANSLNIIGGEFWQRGLHPSWTTQPLEPGKDFDDVAAENNRMCLIEAITAGFVATAPLLMRMAMYRTEAEISNQLRRGRRPPGTLVSGRPAYGTRPSPQGNPMQRGPVAPQRNPGGTLPGGSRPSADPIGKTEPALPKTEPGAAPPRSPAPARPRPLSPAEAQENLKRAADRYMAARQEAYEATREYVQYKNNHPARPGADPTRWDARVAEDLWKKVGEADGQSVARLNELRAAERAARDAAGAAKGGRGGSLFGPPRQAPAAAPGLPGCPPNCGNDNPTGPAGAVQVPGSSPIGALEVGSAGAANSFYPFSWPSGLGQ